MGCFDTVIIECPKCHKEFEEQSKADKCNLRHYRLHNVPMTIAGELAESGATCPHCETRLDIILMGRPHLQVVAHHDDNGEYDEHY